MSEIPGYGSCSRCIHRDAPAAGYPCGDCKHMFNGEEDRWVSRDFPSPVAAGSGAAPGEWLNSLTSAERKEVAIARGLLAYFPDALALVARHSVRSNEKHNPGEPVHWSRGKSSDHEDCIARHSIAVAVNPDSLDGDVPHILCRAWRALAAVQEWAEAKHKRGEKI